MGVVKDSLYPYLIIKNILGYSNIRVGPGCVGPEANIILNPGKTAGFGSI